MSIAVGLLFYFGTRTLVERDASERFAGYARIAQYNIGSRIKSYNDVLRSTASLFMSHYPVTRSEFRGFVTGLDLAHNYSAIEVVNFAQYLHDADRPALERRIRAEEAAAGYRGKPFEIKPPGRRELYHVMTYIEPELVGSSKVGLDLYARDVVRTTLDGLRDNADLLTSGLPLDVMPGKNRVGLGIRLPIYRPGMPISTVAERRAAFVGSVGIAFAVYRLIEGVQDEMAIQNVHMTLVDRTIAADKRPGRLLFDSHDMEADPAEALHSSPDRFSTTLPIEFRRRQWAATFSIAKHDMYSEFEENAPWLAMLAGFTSAFLLYALFRSLASSRERAMSLAGEMTREVRASQAKLELSNQKLRRLAAHADHIKENERKRIAREIHDDLGQNLLALRIEADLLSSRTRQGHPRLHARASATLAHIDTTIKSVRQIINDLRPNVLDLGLSAAVEWQTAEFTRRTGIPCELIDEHRDIALEDGTATALFRILQESLSNIVRHANASRAVVELHMTEAQVQMTISDDGIGFPGAERNKVGSFGLVGIEERVNLLGGSFTLSSQLGRGTTVSVSVPARPERPNRQRPLPAVELPKTPAALA
ncbi:MAG: CHASE domain-containing protein [Massilia sp.]